MKTAAQRVTITAINAAIRAAGGTEELVRGNGYFYFTAGRACHWPATAVYAAHLGAMTVEQWVAEWRCLQEAGNASP